MQEDTYNGSHRFVRGWSISVIVIAAFFVILLTGVYISYQHYKNNLNNFLNEDRIVAKLLSVSIQERKKAIIGSLQCYASRPLLIIVILENLLTSTSLLRLYANSGFTGWC